MIAGQETGLVDPYRASSPPIYQTATFEQEDPEHFGAYDYSRSGNPTRDVLEREVAALEGGRRAFAFASGMAAISACLRLSRPGDRVVVGDDLYGGTYRLLSEVVAPLGIDVVRADTRDPDAVERAVRGGRTRQVWIETPSNPSQEVTDIADVAARAHAAGALLFVDNTMLSPVLQQPLRHGADVVVHSATKWLGGHADLTAGVVVTGGGAGGSATAAASAAPSAAADRIAFLRNAEGTALAPFEAWLLHRGMKTLGLRVERQQENARVVAGFLRGHELVREVYWLGFDDAPGHEIHARQAAGPGAVLAFRTGSDDTSRDVVAGTRRFATTVSFGSLHSTISLPFRMSHASIPERERARRSVPTDLVRVSVGIEAAGELVEDLGRALRGARHLN